MATQMFKGKPIGLLRRAWHEIPDIVAGSALALASIAAYGVLYYYRKNNGTLDHKRYRFTYTVVRPDDPLAVYAIPEESQ